MTSVVDRGSPGRPQGEGDISVTAADEANASFGPMIHVQVPLWPGTEEGSEKPLWWQISTLVADHGEGIMGVGRLSRSQENGTYLTSVTAGLHCFHLHGYTGVSPSGHLLALHQHQPRKHTSQNRVHRRRGAGQARPGRAAVSSHELRWAG